MLHLQVHDVVIYITAEIVDASQFLAGQKRNPTGVVSRSRKTIIVFDFIREINPKLQEGTLSESDIEAIRATLRKLDSILGVIDVDAPLPSPEDTAEVDSLVAEREKARQEQDFATADRLRQEIESKGYSVEDLAQGPKVTKKSD